MTDPGACWPSVRFLTDEHRTRLEQASLRILGEIGMKVLHAGARELLAGAGCTVEGERVKIPAGRVRQALETAPSSITIFDRKGDQAMDLGGRRSYFGTGSDLLWAIEPDGRSRRAVNTEDVRRAARVVDAMENLDFVMSFANPSGEVEPHRAYLASFQAMSSCSTKPIVTTADGAGDLGAMWQVAAELRGGEQRLQEEPYILNYSEPASPLKHPRTSIDKLLLCADRRLPLVYSPAPMAGATAPITVAGHVALGLAECLCGLVIHQLRAPGAPFLLGMGPAVLDLATGQSSYNAPEYLMAYMTMIEMTHHFDKPSWGYAGTSDSQIPDEQATLEAGQLTLLASLAGANLNHDVGYLDFGRAGSLQMVCVLDEVIGMLRRVNRGVVVDDEHLALDAIAEVGHSGNFVAAKHTMKHFRTTQWRPKLLNRQGREKWQAQGGKTLIERAEERLQKVLAEHEPEALDEALAARIEAIVAAYQPS